MPMYEAIDEVTQVKSKAVSKDEYQSLSAIACVGENSALYQTPHSDNDYLRYPEFSDISTEIQLMKKSLRRTKILCLCGVVTMAMLVMLSVIAVIIVFVSKKSVDNILCKTTFAHNLSLEEQAHESLNEQIKYLNEAVNGLKPPRNTTIFKHCFRDTASCNFTAYNDNSWLSCDTPTLYLNKEVSV